MLPTHESAQARAIREEMEAASSPPTDGRDASPLFGGAGGLKTALLSQGGADALLQAQLAFLQAGSPRSAATPLLTRPEGGPAFASPLLSSMYPAPAPYAAASPSLSAPTTEGAAPVASPSSREGIASAVAFAAAEAAAAAARSPPPPAAPAPAHAEGAQGGLAQTLQVLEARSLQAAQQSALAAHAAGLESQLRSQQLAANASEAARRDAVTAQAALAHEVSVLTGDNRRLSSQLEHYIGRCDELVAERGRGAAQLSDLARAVSMEQARGASELESLQAAVKSLEAALVEKGEAMDRMAAEHVAEKEALRADLEEVTRIIEQLEGEPGLVRGAIEVRREELRHAKTPPSVKYTADAGPAAVAAASAATTSRLHELRATATRRAIEVRTLTQELSACDAEAAKMHEVVSLFSSEPNGHGMREAREENRMLEAQLELLSEKMYGSPAKQAAIQRDRLQIELERERGLRFSAEDKADLLRSGIGEANAHLAGEASRLAREEEMASELHRTKLALRAAHTNAAMSLLDSRAPPPTSRKPNPIAMPRSQFRGGAREAPVGPTLSQQARDAREARVSAGRAAEARTPGPHLRTATPTTSRTPRR